jgi:hypothetical protein
MAKGVRRSARVRLSIEDQIAREYNLMLIEWLKQLHKKILALDAGNETTLQVAISSLLEHRAVEQITLAQKLGQSRIQVGRWAKGEHIPRTSAYRKFLVGEVLSFIREKTGLSGHRV